MAEATKTAPKKVNTKIESKTPAKTTTKTVEKGPRTLYYVYKEQYEQPVYLVLVSKSYLKL